jgi:TolB protein
MTAKKKEIIKKNVYDFELSPQGDKFAIEEKLDGKGSSLLIIDLEGKELQTLTKGKMIFGMSWSPDESKLAYLLSSDKESEKGLYIMNLKTLKNIYVSPDFMGIDNGLKWNLAGTKLLAAISEVKDMKLFDYTYIITLN